MLELINSNIETIELYLKPLRKYLNRTDINLECQIKHIRAIWLLSVRDYLITKTFYETNAKKLIEFRKACTDKKGHMFYHSKWIKRKERYPLEHKLRQKRIKNWKKYLIDKHQTIKIFGQLRP